MSNPDHEQDIDQLSGVETTGHEWDGLKELNNPLPRWWLWTFYACIVWAVIYSVFYPAWPLISKATEGTLGWSSRGEVAERLADAEAMKAPFHAEISGMSLEEIRQNPELYGFAQAGGRSSFLTFCSQCHGSGAAGAPGYPNLNDDDWIWGGTLEEIEYTITHGVRWEEDGDTRLTMMPAFGADGILARAEVAAAAEYVLSLSGLEHDAALADEGAAVYEENCASCHMEDGTGDIYAGAPNLADQIWLYALDRDSIKAQINNPKHGVMPSWNTRLSPVEIKQLAIYVHGLGGGVTEE